MRAGLLVALLAGLLAIPTAAAAEGELCSTTADVSWVTNHDDVTVEGAVVDVPGCTDGEPVGLQLLTDDGDVPADGPILTEAQDEQAEFDLAPFAQRIEPVVGVRVYLQMTEEELAHLEITVDRRFFNMPGNEQRGLRQLTILEVSPGGQYRVPAAPNGYVEVACVEVGHDPRDTVAQGSGTFDATASGRHVVCNRQTPGGPRGPIDQDPEVLGRVINRGDTLDGPSPESGGGATNEVLGGVHDRSDGSDGPAHGGLALTGANLWLTILVVVLLVAGGFTLMRVRPRE